MVNIRVNLIMRSAALALLLAALLFVGRSIAADDLSSTLKPLYTLVQQTETAVKANDFNAAKTSFDQFQNKWYELEDAVKGVSLAQYKDIEDKMSDVRVAISANKADAALTALSAIDTNLDATVQLAQGGATATTDSNATVQSLVDKLNVAQAAMGRQDAPAALSALDEAHNSWFSVENAVKGRSVDAYHQFEQDLPLAQGALQKTPPDFTTAGKLISGLSATLTPIASKSGSPYTAFDAGIVLLREGFEAILIITALVAFVVKSGNADKRGWIWAGGAVGIAASILAAIALQAILGAATSGANGMLIEGIVGLIAAAMLFYVSYWLHSKSSITAWTHYIKSKSNAALAGGSLLSLALLAFLSVFREGAETAMFYLGMAGSISASDLLLGIGGGLAALALIAVLMVKLGVRIPIHTFFLISSALIYYLGFKFVGTSILALQGVGWLPTHSLSWLPTLDWLGFYPTIEGVVVQGALIVAGFIVWLYSRRHQAAIAQQMQAEARA